MGIKERLSWWLPDLAGVLIRFPVPALSAALLCIYLNFNEDALDGPSGVDHQVICGAVAGFLASGAAHFFAEGRGLSRAINLALALIAGVIVAAIGYFAQVFATAPLFLFPALVLALMMAAYLRPGAEQGALWLFNLRLGSAALLATIVGVAVGAGLSAITEALNFLFDADLPQDAHKHIWATAITLVGPIFGLALMPKTLDEVVKLADAPDSLIERGVSVLVNYVLVPIVLIYALILHAYGLKIALQWQLPEGEIGTMVSIFALGGTAAWLIAWPWRETGTWLLRQFMRNWFRITIVPAALLFIAVWRRVADYGVTPERYGLVIIALWLALIGAYLAYRRSKADMRAILGGLAALLLVGAFGPWGAKGVTISSQVGRLTTLLEEKGLLRSGKAVAPRPSLMNFDITTAYSILDVLRDVGGLDRLKPWFEDKPGDVFRPEDKDWELANKINEKLGLTSSATQEIHVGFYAQSPASVVMSSGARFIGPLYVGGHRMASPHETEMFVVIEGKEIVFKLAERRWAMQIETLLQRAKSIDDAKPKKTQALVVELAPELTLIVENIYGSLGEPPRVNSAAVWVVLRQ